MFLNHCNVAFGLILKLGEVIVTAWVLHSWYWRSSDQMLLCTAFVCDLKETWKISFQHIIAVHKCRATQLDTPFQGARRHLECIVLLFVFLLLWMHCFAYCICPTSKMASWNPKRRTGMRRAFVLESRNVEFSKPRLLFDFRLPRKTKNKLISIDALWIYHKEFIVPAGLIPLLTLLSSIAFRILCFHRHTKISFSLSK